MCLPEECDYRIKVAISNSRFSDSFIGHPGQDFDWADYLKQCGAEAAPESCFPSVSVHNITCLFSGIYFIDKASCPSTWS